MLRSTVMIQIVNVGNIHVLLEVTNEYVIPRLSQSSGHFL